MIDADLTGKVALVTGAHAGIGAATAAALAAQGARVALHYFTGTALPEGAAARTGLSYGATDGPGLPQGVTAEHMTGDRATAEELAGRLGAVAFEADLTEPDAPARLFDRVEASLAPVDILINNAAHCELPDDTLSLTSGSLHRTYAVNLHAPALLTAELARRASGTNRGAAVVNISTDAARAFAHQVAYGTSKAALESFTRAAAIELGPSGIRVNTIAPGPVQTGWMSDTLVAEVVPQIPLRRVGTPEDIADAVVFLASAQARWITGQVIQVAGGHAL